MGLSERNGLDGGPRSPNRMNHLASRMLARGRKRRQILDPTSPGAADSERQARRPWTGEPLPMARGAKPGPPPWYKVRSGDLFVSKRCAWLGLPETRSGIRPPGRGPHLHHPEHRHGPYPLPRLGVGAIPVAADLSHPGSRFPLRLLDDRVAPMAEAEKSRRPLMLSALAGSGFFHSSLARAS